jgi:hypothetical protein
VRGVVVIGWLSRHCRVLFVLSRSFAFSDGGDQGVD